MNTKKINSGKTLMVAHRGLSGIETENTCAAFIAAGNRSYFGIETDVHVTLDGKFAIGHDNSMLRVSGEDYVIEETDYETLSKIRLFDIYTKEKRCDLVVPELKDYANICKKYEKASILELKGRMTEDQLTGIIEVMRSCGQLENTIFISFNLDNCKDIRRMLPEQKVQFLTGKWTDELFQTLINEKIDLDIYYESLTKERVELLHSNGIVVNSWTCDNLEHAEKLVEMGVDQITTNILE